MSKSRNALRAGIFILASVGVIVAIIIGISGIENFTARWKTHTVRFKLSDDIGGLAEGDEVRLGGYKVGVVRDIDVTELEAIERGEEPAIIVEFTIPDRYVLRDNAQIGIQETVTGTTWLNISSLGSGNALPEGTPLAGGPSTTTRLLRQLEKITPEINGLVVDVRTQTVPRVNATVDKAGETAVAMTDLVKRIREHVDPMVVKYHAAADRASEMFVQVRDLLGDTKGDIRGTLANLNTATTDVKDKLPGILDKLDASLGSGKQVVDKAIAVLSDLGPAMQNTRDITGSARSLLTGNRSKIEDMVTSLKETGDNLKAASAEIRRSPWRLLYKPRPNEMANLNVYDAARQFADGANDLNDAAGALRDALNTHDLDEEQLKQLLENLDATFQNFDQVEEDLWKRVRE
jgi:ABC-type transporter Mla subunit MlaD